MAARKWTAAQKAQQSLAIQNWQPWQHSTGATTATGRATISRNAYRGGTRPLIRFSRWFYRAIESPENLTPEIVDWAKQRCATLWSGNIDYRSTSITKLIKNHGHSLSESDIIELNGMVTQWQQFKQKLNSD
jgi:hypothetical protein